MGWGPVKTVIEVDGVNAGAGVDGSIGVDARRLACAGVDAVFKVDASTGVGGVDASFWRWMSRCQYWSGQSTGVEGLDADVGEGLFSPESAHTPPPGG